jgi:iron complex transport system ATP-binding protein
LVAVVPQEVAPVFAFTVLEMVLMGRSPYLSAWGGAGPNDWTLARRAMMEAEVQHLADRPFQELSGGERQRVVLAQALAQDAPVLLLDEPTTHLDLGHVFDIMARVRDLARTEDRAVLAVFHDLNLASAFCDRIYVLDGGRVTGEGTPAEVIQPAMIRRVFGVATEVVPNAAEDRPAVFFGAITQARPKRREALRAHVVGGGGRGADLIRALAERGFEVTVGVLHATDSDASVAERLNLERVTVPPFSHIDPRSAADCRDMIRRARILILCDAPFGPANLENLRLAVEAAEAGTVTIVVDQMPIGERDFTGGDATALWGRVKAVAAVAGSPDEGIGLVMAAARSERA